MSDFFRQIAFNESYDFYTMKLIDKYPKDEDDDKYEIELDSYYHELKETYSIPDGMWKEYGITSDELDVEDYKNKIRLWCEGKLGCEESYKLYYYLHEIIDIDSSLVFFSIPEGKLHLYQKFDYVNSVIDIGARNVNEVKKSREEIMKIAMQVYYEDQG
ncbi:MAG: hypothetical protein AB8B80_08085 [Marinicellaceae bacterium]